jgi:quercetin dioxygenase-like cupin family protein
MKRTNFAAVLLGLILSPVAVAQQSSIMSKPVAERKVAELPTRPLFWRIDNFPTVAEAQAASGTYGLVVEAVGKVWLFTLGSQGQPPSGGTKVAEIGPLADVSATQYLIRVNEGSGSPGSTTSVHTHPGSEAYYMMAGEASQKTQHGVNRIAAGESMAGHGAGTIMQLINTGETDVSYFALFVVDATKPFSSPATFP